MTMLRGGLMLCLVFVTLGCEETAQAPAPPTTAPAAATTTAATADSDAAPAAPADTGATATGGVIDTPSPPQ